MVLLSGLIRTAAVTGRTDNLAEWFAGRQGGRWAEQMVRSAVPARAPQSGPTVADPAEALRELAELHRRGLLTDAELESAKRWVPGGVSERA